MKSKSNEFAQLVIIGKQATLIAKFGTELAGAVNFDNLDNILGEIDQAVALIREAKPEDIGGQLSAFKEARRKLANEYNAKKNNWQQVMVEPERARTHLAEVDKLKKELASYLPCGTNVDEYVEKMANDEE